MEVGEAVSALRAGLPVVLPTDTVYGLCADASSEAAVERLRRLKGTPAAQPIALVAPDLDVILAAVPELDGRAAALADALLPGPYTLVLENPAGRFHWLGGADPTKLGIRVPDLPGEIQAVLREVGGVAATSANIHGGRDPARVDEIPAEIRQGLGALVDGGELPGAPSTVVDLTAPQPRVVREGAVSAEEALARIACAASE
jgi:L-threonylcarbamoyladenylate synthase